MRSTDVPTPFVKVFAAAAAAGYIRTVPVASQIGIQDGAASFTDGFVPDNFIAIAAGGVPPFGQDFNGLLKAMTTWEQWNQAGGPIVFNSTFSSAIGGYPAGAMLSSAVTHGLFWVSTADNNTTDPDSGGAANWLAFAVPVAASPAETAAGVDNVKYVTPYDLAQAKFPHIVDSNLIENGGHRAWSDGLIECWGYADVPANTIMTVGLPYPHTSWINPGGSGMQPSTSNNRELGVCGIVTSAGVPTGILIINPNGGGNGPYRFWWNSRGK